MNNYTQQISSYIAAEREQIPRNIDNYVTGVSERSQQRGNLKDKGNVQLVNNISLDASLRFFSCPI
ncbi:hypothetical protein XCR1_1630005 [Xenorhabdus cabanillasii JM26]|uniref:Uncharacterized protein n=1 Tax=Xenorhabdus cabanillasii JM26 TaxID=1427517 RepID=W1IUB3_9GAMM|nr:hypothetical protein XCR1_1630005 [Xenorhabdus cabanillasii JM26]